MLNRRLMHCTALCILISSAPLAHQSPSPPLSEQDAVRFADDIRKIEEALANSACRHHDRWADSWVVAENEQEEEAAILSKVRLGAVMSLQDYRTMDAESASK